MAAVMSRTEVGVREFGTIVNIPSDPKARCMYYLDSMCVVLDLNDKPNINRLRNYNSYYSLTEPETDALLALCFLLSPKDLLGKVIFQDDAMCGDSSNAFFEISAVKRNLLVSESIIIGGQQRRVTKIMAFKQAWMVKNWIEPMKYFAPRLARIATEGSGVAAPPPRPAIQYRQPVYTPVRTNAVSAPPPRPAIQYRQPVYTPVRTSAVNSGCCTIL